MILLDICDGSNNRPDNEGGEGTKGLELFSCPNKLNVKMCLKKCDHITKLLANVGNFLSCFVWATKNVNVQRRELECPTVDIQRSVYVLPRLTKYCENYFLIKNYRFDPHFDPEKHNVWLKR